MHPPPAVLDGMVALRVHLDDCGESSGPLRVPPGSHGAGRLDAAAIARRRRDVAEVVCAVPRGGVLAFRPLLPHASSAATRPHHRRVVHLEFAVAELPGGLAWYERH